MINDKIFAHGATSITVEVADWKRDKITPASFRCRIEHPSHHPSAVVAVRPTMQAAEREATEAFLTQFKAGSGAKVHGGAKSLRSSSEATSDAIERDRKATEAPKPLPKAKPAVTKVDDDFEY